MRQLEATGQYTDDQINRMVRGGKLRGHIPGVGPVLPERVISRPSMPAPTNASQQEVNKNVEFMMSFFRSDNRFADAFAAFESGGASGSGGTLACDGVVQQDDDAQEDTDSES